MNIPGKSITSLQKLPLPGKSKTVTLSHQLVHVTVDVEVKPKGLLRSVHEIDTLFLVGVEDSEVYVVAESGVILVIHPTHSAAVVTHRNIQHFVYFVQEEIATRLEFLTREVLLLEQEELCSVRILRPAAITVIEATSELTVVVGAQQPG